MTHILNRLKIELKVAVEAGGPSEETFYKEWDDKQRKDYINEHPQSKFAQKENGNKPKKENGNKPTEQKEEKPSETEPVKKYNAKDLRKNLSSNNRFPDETLENYANGLSNLGLKGHINFISPKNTSGGLGYGEYNSEYEMILVYTEDGKVATTKLSQFMPGTKRYLKNEEDLEKLFNPSESQLKRLKTSLEKKINTQKLGYDPKLQPSSEEEANQLRQVSQNWENIRYIKDPTEKVQLLTVKKKPGYIRYIKNPSEKVQLEAIKSNPTAIKYIENPSENIQLEAVRNSDYFHPALEYIKNPSEKVQLEAVKTDGGSIKFIKNPTEEMKREAIEKTPWAIKYIENPSEDLQMAAVRKNSIAIEYIKDPSEAVQLEAVKRNPIAIRWIKDPSEAVQLEAVKGDPTVIEDIENPTEKVKQLSKKL